MNCLGGTRIGWVMAGARFVVFLGGSFSWGRQWLGLVVFVQVGPEWNCAVISNFEVSRGGWEGFYGKVVFSQGKLGNGGNSHLSMVNCRFCDGDSEYIWIVWVGRGLVELWQVQGLWFSWAEVLVGDGSGWVWWCSCSFVLSEIVRWFRILRFQEAVGNGFMGKWCSLKAKSEMVEIQTWAW